MTQERNVDFGFGCMRLPVLQADQPDSFDYGKINRLFDAFIEKGFTYFDTAYTYHGYHAEEAVRRALVERHPRDSFQLVTKLPLRDFKDAEDMERIFNEQLAHCGVEYFDYYLLHNMGTNVYEKCKKYDAFGFVDRKKAEGKIHQVGMSFHDTPELLDEILSQYGDVLDFIQLQINYVDWEQPNVQSRRCLEVAGKYGKPVTVMEPCKGGTLVNLPEEAEALLKAQRPDASNASWALRFVGSLDGIATILSGMSSEEQMEDNLSTFRNFKPLTEKEKDIIAEVVRRMQDMPLIACTSCRYCCDGCPSGIAIPDMIRALNTARLYPKDRRPILFYRNLVLDSGKASSCIACGQCESVCPQHLPIIELMKEAAEKLEEE